MHWQKLTRRRSIAILLVAILVGLVAYAYWLEPHWLKTRVIRLSKGEPSIRVVHFTDLHFKGDKKYTKRLIKRINRLKPDLVCFTGDLIDEPKYLPDALELLSQIKAPLYGVPGNHDFWASVNFDSIRKAFASTGGCWLMNECVRMNNAKITIYGAATQPPNFNPQPGTKNILLMHYPDWVDRIHNAKFDLILAGHSHGGQVRLPLIGPIIEIFHATKYTRGLYLTDAGPLYVGAGVGWFYTRVRFNCRPEITLIEL